jgi:hypothetical protein
VTHANPSTQRMCTHPTNRAIVAFLKERGAASRDEIQRHLTALDESLVAPSRFAKLLGRGVPGQHHTGPGSVCTLCAWARAALFDLPLPIKVQPAPEPAPEPELEPVEDPMPSWVGQKVSPNTYDVMNAPVYVPPHMASGRPGADDFRNCPSRGHRC